MLTLRLLLLASITVTLVACSTMNTTPPKDRTEVFAVLDRLHTAAAAADAPVYWSCFDDQAVFLGTDASERWTLDEFKAYAAPHFASGKGWTYTPSDRHVAFATTGDVAWFDEVVTSAKYGPCRGTGVLVKAGDQWKITQYNLTVPIPNDLLPAVAEQIRTSGANARP